MTRLAIFVLLVLFSVALCFDSDNSTLTAGSNCGGNCPGGHCPNCWCGTQRRMENIAEWCSKFGGWNQACCRCIVQHESSGNAHAINHNTGGSDDVGMWQINSMNWNMCSSGKAPCDPQVNLKCAITIWNYHKSFKLWSTCRACGCC